MGKNSICPSIHPYLGQPEGSEWQSERSEAFSRGLETSSKASLMKLKANPRSEGKPAESLA